MQTAVDFSLSVQSPVGLDLHSRSDPNLTFVHNEQTIGTYSHIGGAVANSHDPDAFIKYLRHLELAYASPFPMYEGRVPQMRFLELAFGDKNPDRPQSLPFNSIGSLNQRVRLSGGRFVSDNIIIMINRVASTIRDRFRINTRFADNLLEADNVSASTGLLANRMIVYWIKKQQAESAGGVWNATVPDELSLFVNIQQIVRVRNFYLKHNHVPSSDEVFANFDGNDSNDTIDGGPDFGDLVISQNEINDPDTLKGFIVKATALRATATKAVTDATSALTAATSALNTAEGVLKTVTVERERAQLNVRVNAFNTNQAEETARALSISLAGLKQQLASLVPGSQPHLDKQIEILDTETRMKAETDKVAKLTNEQRNNETILTQEELNFTKAEKDVESSESAVAAAQKELALKSKDQDAKVKLAKELSLIEAGVPALLAEFKKRSTVVAVADRVVQEARGKRDAKTVELGKAEVSLAETNQAIDVSKDAYDEVQRKEAAGVALSKAETDLKSLHEKLLANQQTLVAAIVTLTQEAKDLFDLATKVSVERATALDAEKDAIDKLQEGQRAVTAARLSVVVSTSIPTTEELRIARMQLSTTLTPRNLQNALGAVTIDIIIEELKSLSFAQTRERRKNQALIAVDMLEDLRSRIPNESLNELRRLAASPIQTFVENETFDMSTDGDTFTRSYKPSEQAIAAMSKLIGVK